MKSYKGQVMDVERCTGGQTNGCMMEKIKPVKKTLGGHFIDAVVKHGYHLLDQRPEPGL